MLARFSVAYERFCRLLVAIFVVNVAILAHTQMGAVVLGFLPSFAAAQATFRAWVLSEDRSMRAKEVWKTFHGFWKSEVKRANLFGRGPCSVPCGHECPFQADGRMNK